MMTKGKTATKYLPLLIVFVIFCGTSYGSQNRRIPKGCEWIEVTTGFRSVVEKVAIAINFERWPQSNLRKVPPNINKSLLLNSGLVTEIGPYFNNETRFAGNCWTECEWLWERRVVASKPLPIEFSPERKKRLLEILPAHKRNDPNFVAEYLKRKLDRERRSKRYKFDVTGSISLRLCITPCSRAAQEYILSDLPLRSAALPPEALAYRYSESKRVDNLGTIGFSEQSDRPEGYAHVMFVRDNIAVIIDARGELASEALPFAHKIDSLIQKQPGLTYEQLLARRPSIKIDPEVIKSKTGEKTVSYNISAPAGQQIVDVKAYVNDQSTPVRNGKIHIIRKTGKVKVKVVATTSELLTNTFEKEVNVPE